jgi:hypothetical protein
MAAHAAMRRQWDEEVSFHVPFVAGTPRNIPGQNYGVGVAETTPMPTAPPPISDYDYNKNQDWKNYVLPDGNISPTPFGSGRRWWGPV